MNPKSITKIKILCLSTFCGMMTIATLTGCSKNAYPTKEVNGVALPYQPIQITVEGGESFDLVTKMNEGNFTAFDNQLKDKKITVTGTIRSVGSTQDHDKISAWIETNALCNPNDKNGSVSGTYDIQFETQDKKIFNYKTGDRISITGKYSGHVLVASHTLVLDCTVN
jgi:hypothetical protein